MKTKKKPLPPFDKYFHYKKSVQSPKEDIQFFQSVYKSIFKKKAKVFREDFCGTFYIGYHWVKNSKQNKAVVVDEDINPLEYGKKHHFLKLKKPDRSRLQILNKNVLEKSLPKAEIISVSNFSYFIFKKRKDILQYFTNIRHALFKQGLFIIDVTGGPAFEDTSEEITKYNNFNYYWDQVSFDPINRIAQFYIHFKRKGEKKQKKVFSYYWRMWTLAELKDILHDAGFSKIHVYWEQSNKKNEGNGVFKKTLQGEICHSWIAYLVCKS